MKNKPTEPQEPVDQKPKRTVKRIVPIIAPRGRKPVKDKKIQVTIYVEISKINKRGGLHKVKELLINFLNK